MLKQTKILGIDPGFARIGYGFIKKDKDKLETIDFGCIETDKKLEFSERLFQLHNELEKIIKKNKPDIIAIEKLFFFKNLKTAIDVAQARGVIMLTAKQAKTQIQEYTPLEVKQAVTGYGRADKTQVAKMVELVLKLKKMPKLDDTVDALAIAITASQTRKFFEIK